jgi:histidinol-phosphate aminotransferase
MKIIDSIRSEIRGLNNYKAGVMPKPSKTGRQVKLASNENPFGSSPLAIEAIRKALDGGLALYPDSAMTKLREAVCAFWKRRGIEMTPGELLFGDASGEILHMCLAAFLRDGDAVVMPENSFILYSLFSLPKGGRVVEGPRGKNLEVDLDKILEAVYREKAKVVIFSNPDNPTSTFRSREEIEAFMEKVPESTAVILDEAYIHFADLENSFVGMREGYPNLIIVYTYAKAYGLAGLRVGYGVMKPEIAMQIEKTRLPFNLGTLQQVGAIAALDDEKFLETTVAETQKNRAILVNGLEGMGLKVLPDQKANLGAKAPAINKALAENGVSLRDMGSFGYEGNYARVSVGRKEDMEYVLDIIKSVI